MIIKALEFYTNGEMTEGFAFGGSKPKEDINLDKKYPSSLQNFLIDTGDEVILVDTGMPKEVPDMPKKPGQPIYTGEKIADFETALKNAGYSIEDVDKVLVTHKHPDHAGEVRMFTNAQVYLSAIEAEAMKLEGENIHPLSFKDGAYKNFAASEVIAPGIRMIPAYGHTNGNSLILVEEEDCFYMLHGDITYTDEALLQNELSVVFEDRDAAIDTLNTVREFISQNPTVYLSTHTPEGVTNLRDKKIMAL